MFAVKGWSIDASTLKAQVDAPAADRVASGGQPRQDSRKRKRGDGQARPTEDVGKLWEQHIEGKDPAKAKKVRQKQKKRQKLDDHKDDIGHAQLGNGLDNAKGSRDNERPEDVATATGAEKRGKKRKQKRDSNQGERPKQSDSPDGSKRKLDLADSTPPSVPPLPTAAKLTPMQAAMRQKLTSARFRHLNQTLYTAPSATALELFDQNPDMFEDYHAGFRQQVGVWPENPLDHYVASLRTRGGVKSKHPDKKAKRRPADDPDADGTISVQALPRTHGTCVVADLGCGDARLAHTIKDSGDITKFNLKIQSYDLHSPSPLVTKADISELPLADGSVDVAIFCLALMGTNWISFIEEAYRVLHWKGELWVAEIKSRFGRVGRAGKPVEHSVGSKKKQAALQKAREAKQRENTEVDEAALLRTEVDGMETKQEETDVSAFVEVLRKRGFVLKHGDGSIDLSNKMFVKMEFVKAAPPTKGKGVTAAEQTGGAKGAHGKKKFVDDVADDIATDDEAKVLKPCLYKIR